MTLAPDTPYMSASDVRARVSGLGNDTLYPDELLEGFVAEWEGLIEGIVGRAFTPRTFTETIIAPNRGPLLLGVMDVIEITSIAYDQGTAPTLPDGVRVGDGGWSLALTPSPSSWPRGVEITVGGTCAATPDGPPAVVLSGGAEYVRSEAIQAKSEQPRNTTGTRTDLGWEPAPVANRKAGAWTRWVVVNEKIDQIVASYGERAPRVA